MGPAASPAAPAGAAREAQPGGQCPAMREGTLGQAQPCPKEGCSGAPKPSEGGLTPGLPTDPPICALGPGPGLLQGVASGGGAGALEAHPLTEGFIHKGRTGCGFLTSMGGLRGGGACPRRGDTQSFRKRRGSGGDRAEAGRAPGREGVPGKGSEQRGSWAEGAEPSRGPWVDRAWRERPGGGLLCFGTVAVRLWRVRVPRGPWTGRGTQLREAARG